MSNLPFEFTVNKADRTVYIQRSFSAQIQQIWDVFSQADLLDRWWAPQPWVSRTRSMEFRVGGRRLYAMVGPDGKEYWSAQEYVLIEPLKRMDWNSFFTDAEGRPQEDLHSSRWRLDFSQNGEQSEVRISIVLRSLTDLEQMIQMGFREGFTQTLNYLDEWVSRKSKS